MGTEFIRTCSNPNGPWLFTCPKCGKVYKSNTETFEGNCLCEKGKITPPRKGCGSCGGRKNS